MPASLDSRDLSDLPELPEWQVPRDLLDRCLNVVREARWDHLGRLVHKDSRESLDLPEDRETSSVVFITVYYSLSYAGWSKTVKHDVDH